MNSGKGFLGMGIFMVFLSLILNLAFWGGLIYFVFWCLQHFGVI